MDDNPFLTDKKSDLVQIFIDELINIRDGDGLVHLHNEDDTIDRYITLKEVLLDNNQ